MASPLDLYLLDTLSDLATEYLSLEEIIELKLPVSDSVLRSKMTAYDVNALMAPQDPATPPRQLTSLQQDAVAAAVWLGEEIPGLADHLTEVSRFPTSLGRIVLKAIFPQLTRERVVPWSIFQEIDYKNVNRSLAKRIIRAVLHQRVPGTDEAIAGAAGVVKSIALIRTLLRHGVNPSQIMDTEIFDPAFQEQVWEVVLEELSPPKIMEALTTLIQLPNFNPHIVTLTLAAASADPALFDPFPGRNILTALMERQGGYLSRLLDHPQFNPARVVDYLLGSSLYVRWIPTLTRLFHSPQVQAHTALIKAELPRLIEYARSLKRTKVITFLANLLTTM